MSSIKVTQSRKASFIDRIGVAATAGNPASILSIILLQIWQFYSSLIPDWFNFKSIAQLISYWTKINTDLRNNVSHSFKFSEYFDLIVRDFKLSVFRNTLPFFYLFHYLPSHS